MKTLFGKFGFPLLALIAIIVVLSAVLVSRQQHHPTPKCPDPEELQLVLKIGKGSGDFVHLLDPGGDPNKGFNQAMSAIKKGQYNVHYVDNKGQNPKDYCKSRGLDDSTSIKTDNIITSEVARSAQVQGSAANDPNVMHKIASPDPTEIAGVLNTLSASP